MGAGAAVGFGQGHLGLGADGGDGRAQLVRRIGGEAALGRHHRGDALEQPVQCVEHGLHLGRCAGHLHRRQALRVAGGQGVPQGAQRGGAAPHGPPHGQRQQRQGHGHRPQHAAQHRPEDVAAAVGLLADEHPHVAVGTLGHEHPPRRTGQLHVMEAQAQAGLPRRGRAARCVAVVVIVVVAVAQAVAFTGGGHGVRRQLHHRRGRCVGRARHQLPFMPDLEGHTRRIAVQLRRIPRLVVVMRCTGLLHHQQCGGLRQVAVEQFVQLMLHVGPGGRGRGHPHRHHRGQQQGQQAALQRRWPARAHPWWPVVAAGLGSR